MSVLGYVKLKKKKKKKKKKSGFQPIDSIWGAGYKLNIKEWLIRYMNDIYRCLDK